MIDPNATSQLREIDSIAYKAIRDLEDFTSDDLIEGPLPPVIKQKLLRALANLSDLMSSTSCCIKARQERLINETQSKVSK